MAKLNEKQLKILLRALDLFEGHEDVSIETSCECQDIETILEEILLNLPVLK